MYRIDTAVILLAILPFVMAIVFRTSVMPRRRSNMVMALRSAESVSQQVPSDGNEYVRLGAERVSREFESQYSLRLLFPALILSILYVIGLSLGLLLLAEKQEASCPDWFCRHLACIPYDILRNPIAALLGCYVFNTGVLVRRAFVADVTKNVFWGSINRIVFSVGISIAIAISPIHSDTGALLTSFAIAFFPGLFITWLKKLTRKTLTASDSPVEELDIQL